MDLLARYSRNSAAVFGLVLLVLILAMALSAAVVVPS